MTKAPKDQDEPTEEEIERRRDKIARRMLNTPPKPRKSKPKPATRARVMGSCKWRGEQNPGTNGAEQKRGWDGRAYVGPFPEGDGARITAG